MPPKIPESHPRYRSLVTREKLVQACEEGLVAWEGLLAHGRGETFDYLLGERSVPEALHAEKAASAHLLMAEKAAISVNGNVAVLAAERIRRLLEATGAVVEVNLFHRTEERVRRIADLLTSTGIRNVLGTHPDAAIPGLEHDRALCSKEGIFGADVVLIPLEDGDRAEALARMGKVVISVDLNPLSRTSREATIAIVDEVSRALDNMVEFAEELKGRPEAIRGAMVGYEKGRNLAGVLKRIWENLETSQQ
ncbi:MAG: phosphopantothenate/pantothenate synthetase [Candidatus Thermoplasmatota archaeon]|nr:phosphopantothenate/pantothenate synthetase [Candidatus Thermoplasmatota archaeon]